MVRLPSKNKEVKLPAWRLWLFRLMAVILIPAVLIVLLEIGLRIFGYGYPTDFALKEKIDGRKVYLNNLSFCWRFFPKNIARPQLPFSIPVDKPKDSYRIFILGGSAAWGTPDHTYSFGRILEVMLRDRFPGIHFELVNAAVTAINSHVVLEIAKDCAEYQPDLFVTYLGNNEVVGPFGAGTVFSPLSPSLFIIRLSLWAKTIRTGQLLGNLMTAISPKSTPVSWKGMEMFLKKQVPADSPALEIVYNNFK